MLHFLIWIKDNKDDFITSLIEFHTDGPWILILSIPTNCHKILNNSWKETFKVLKNYHQRRTIWNWKILVLKLLIIVIDNDLIQLNNLFTKETFNVVCPWHQRWPNVISVVGWPGTRCPEVSLHVGGSWAQVLGPLPQGGSCGWGGMLSLLHLPCASLTSSLQWQFCIPQLSKLQWQSRCIRWDGLRQVPPINI